MAVWPVTLPSPEVQGYRLSPVDQSIRSDMEFGAARSRRVTAARNDRVTVRWQFNDTQFTAFRTWFEDDAKGGSEWFNGMELAVGGGITTPDCRFIGSFSSEEVFGNLTWIITAQLEVR